MVPEGFDTRPKVAAGGPLSHHWIRRKELDRDSFDEQELTFKGVA
jgi:hypothetical protein